jgi:hypothetical protein
MVPLDKRQKEDEGDETKLFLCSELFYGTE